MSKGTHGLQVWLLRGKRREDAYLRDMWVLAMDEMIAGLLFKSTPSGLSYIADYDRCAACEQLWGPACMWCRNQVFQLHLQASTAAQVLPAHAHKCQVLTCRTGRRGRIKHTMDHSLSVSLSTVGGLTPSCWHSACSIAHY